MPKQPTGFAGQTVQQRLEELERENAYLRQALNPDSPSCVEMPGATAEESVETAALRRAIEAAGMSAWAYDPRTNEAVHLAGQAGDASGPRRPLDQFLALWHPDDREAVAGAFRASYARSEKLLFEARPLDPGGSGRWIAAAGGWVTEPNGASPGLFWVQQDITEHRQADEQRTQLLDRIGHRFKNTLVLIQATAWQTGQRATDVTGFLELFDGRLRAIAVAHDLLTRGGRQGPSLAALIRAVIAEQEEHLTQRIAIEVEDLSLNATMVQHLALVVHELTLNAATHGALSEPGGSVTLTGTISGEELVLTWREVGGPTVTKPAAQGFSTMLLERVVARRYGGRATFDWQPAGLVCTLSLPLAKVRG